jgi:hypothetical protein
MLYDHCFQIAFRINYLPEGERKPGEFKLDMTHQLLMYVDNINLFCEHVNTVQKGTGVLLDAFKIGLEENAEKTKYRSMLFFHQKKVGKNHNFRRLINLIKLWQNQTRIWRRH